jgi:hypothetical protein
MDTTVTRQRRPDVLAAVTAAVTAAATAATRIGAGPANARQPPARYWGPPSTAADCRPPEWVAPMQEPAEPLDAAYGCDARARPVATAMMASLGLRPATESRMGRLAYQPRTRPVDAGLPPQRRWAIDRCAGWCWSRRRSQRSCPIGVRSM